MRPRSTYRYDDDIPAVAINTLVANVTTTFLSFGFAFWVYLVTHSVLAASVVSGVSMLIGAASGTIFGAVVDSHRKKTAMALSSSITGVAFTLAGACTSARADS